jgi:hypothetical protein
MSRFASDDNHGEPHVEPWSFTADGSGYAIFRYGKLVRSETFARSGDPAIYAAGNGRLAASIVERLNAEHELEW